MTCARCFKQDILCQESTGTKEKQEKCEGCRLAKVKFLPFGKKVKKSKNCKPSVALLYCDHIKIKKEAKEEKDGKTFSIFDIQKQIAALQKKKEKKKMETDIMTEDFMKEFVKEDWMKKQRERQDMELEEEWKKVDLKRRTAVVMNQIQEEGKIQRREKKEEEAMIEEVVEVEGKGNKEEDKEEEDKNGDKEEEEGEVAEGDEEEEEEDGEEEERSVEELMEG